MLARRTLLQGAAGLLGFLSPGKSRPAQAGQSPSAKYDLPLPREDELVSSNILLTASQDPIVIFRLYFREPQLPQSFGCDGCEAILGAEIKDERPPMLCVFDGKPGEAFNKLDPSTRPYASRGILRYWSFSRQVVVNGRCATVPTMVCDLSNQETAEYVREYLLTLLQRRFPLDPEAEERFLAVVKHVYRWVTDITEGRAIGCSTS